MRSQGLSIKTIVAIGIGSAVFVILGRFASIPSGIPNTSVETAYAFLALMSVIFGPIAGGLIGFIGHALKDAIFYGTPWWSWVVVSAFVGFGIGLFTRKIKVDEGVFGTKQIVLFNIVQAVIQAVGWFLIAPILDIVIYAEPANKVFTQGIFAGISNIVTVGIIGTILIATYAKTQGKSDSLAKE
ncbi:ECF-type riboflavin transporter substrate-binding protein [Virgibacillus doumboii]|uniref:ECF-type riboflavin transporter substrate-binding protein n=1 Tax=Virgibacillus doumboii TaxID=2697503 RepID=UPI0013DF3824|nr:ECF-type riboflavin transporter substrate-binding protein [Virgibacillus doumboii]